MLCFSSLLCQRKAVSARSHKMDTRYNVWNIQMHVLHVMLFELNEEKIICINLSLFYCLRVRIVIENGKKCVRPNLQTNLHTQNSENTKRACELEICSPSFYKSWHGFNLKNGVSTDATFHIPRGIEDEKGETQIISKKNCKFLFLFLVSPLTNHVCCRVEEPSEAIRFRTEPS